jgi:hypothetical protein
MKRSHTSLNTVQSYGPAETLSFLHGSAEMHGPAETLSFLHGPAEMHGPAATLSLMHVRVCRYVNLNPMFMFQRVL